MELKELCQKLKELFNVSDIQELPSRLFEIVRANDDALYSKFVNMVQDLTIDWLQMIYQYYFADRKEKMQDYTPKSLAEFMGKLAGQAEMIVDLCAGSGALTIQKWAMNHKQRFELYEFDENVIPFLLFNMAVRNIECTVNHADVLQETMFNKYVIKKGEQFGKFEESLRKDR